jgi:hypothetical protein
LADNGRVKSAKEQLQIACKERKYNVVSRHEFSGTDASGDAISSVNLSERDHYQWLSMKPDINGLLPVICRGQPQRPTSWAPKARSPGMTYGVAGDSATGLPIPPGWR